MSKKSGAHTAAATTGPTTEAGIRQLLEKEQSKAALESAKQYHKQANTPASEGLLLDAYCARIQSLLAHNLAPEAKALIEVVRGRFPSAGARVDVILLGVAVAAGELDDLLRPLNDLELDPERRAGIEQVIRTQVADLGALSNCATLPEDHALRQAARALDGAFQLVTTGQVTDEQIALPEISHRSPLAGWRTLVRAIACLYRGEKQTCKDLLAAIKPDAVVARLIPAIEAMLGQPPATPLKPAAARLVTATSGGSEELSAALQEVEGAFNHGSDAAVCKALRVAVQACRRAAPEQMERFRRYVSVRADLANIESKRVATALEGAAAQDAEYFRIYARALELSRDQDCMLEACCAWDFFRKRAVSEGLLKENGDETATLYLHMASLFDDYPDHARAVKVRVSSESIHKSDLEGIYYWYPEKLYARACALDPSKEGFSKWLNFAKGQSRSGGEPVAKEWQRLRPDDLEPVLFLMERAEQRDAYPMALGLLAQAERIDPVHSGVRAARMRLLASSVIRHVQQKKPHLAKQKLDELGLLPEARQGDRLAFVAAMREIIALVSNQPAAADEARAEAERILGSRVAAMMLVFALTGLCKRTSLAKVPFLEELTKEERGSMPAALSHMMRVLAGVGITKLGVPAAYVDEVERQFPQVKGSLGVQDLRQLAGLGRALERPKLAWGASNEGLSRGGATEAFFLMARAHAMPKEVNEDRFDAIAAAAVALGRLHGNTEVVDHALNALRNPHGGDTLTFTVEQAHHVVKREKSSPQYPSHRSPGPNYYDLLADFRCRMPPPDFFDDDDDDDEFEDDFGDDDNVPDFASVLRQMKAAAPPEMPKELIEAMAKFVLKGMLEGKSPDKALSEFLGSIGGPGKKGRNKR